MKHTLFEGLVRKSDFWYLALVSGSGYSPDTLSPVLPGRRKLGSVFPRTPSFSSGQVTDESGLYTNTPVEEPWNNNIICVMCQVKDKVGQNRPNSETQSYDLSKARHLYRFLSLIPLDLIGQLALWIIPTLSGGPFYG